MHVVEVVLQLGNLYNQLTIFDLDEVRYDLSKIREFMGYAFDPVERFIDTTSYSCRLRVLGLAWGSVASRFHRYGSHFHVLADRLLWLSRFSELAIRLPWLMTWCSSSHVRAVLISTILAVSLLTECGRAYRCLGCDSVLV